MHNAHHLTLYKKKPQVVQLVNNNYFPHLEVDNHTPHHMHRFPVAYIGRRVRLLVELVVCLRLGLGLGLGLGCLGLIVNRTKIDVHRTNNS